MRLTLGTVFVTGPFIEIITILHIGPCQALPNSLNAQQIPSLENLLLSLPPGDSYELPLPFLVPLPEMLGFPVFNIFMSSIQL